MEQNCTAVDLIRVDEVDQLQPGRNVFGAEPSDGRAHVSACVVDWFW